MQHPSVPIPAPGPHPRPEGEDASGAGQARRAAGGPGPAQPGPGRGASAQAGNFPSQPSLSSRRGWGWGGEGDPGSDRTISTLEIRAPGTPLPPLPSRWNPPEPQAAAEPTPQEREEGPRGDPRSGAPRSSPFRALYFFNSLPLPQKLNIAFYTRFVPMIQLCRRKFGRTQPLSLLVDSFTSH